MNNSNDNTKKSYSIAFIASVVLILFSFYLQMSAKLQPCALCVLQRGTLFILSGILLLGALFQLNKLGRILISSLASLVALLGVVLSGRQAWLQHLPNHNGENCAASLQYMLKVLPFHEVIQRIFNGSPECSESGWTLLSLSLAEWSLICFSLFLIFAIWRFIKSWC